MLAKNGTITEYRVPIKINEANKDLINDPDLIYPGQELKVPGA